MDELEFLPPSVQQPLAGLAGRPDDDIQEVEQVLVVCGATDIGRLGP